MSSAFFQPRDGALFPQERAYSQWRGGNQIRGMAVSGALARAAEQAASEGDVSGGLHPARWTLDLLRPASAAPCVASAQVLRRGKRLCLVDALMHQGDRLVARGTGLFLAAGQEPPGTVWAAPAAAVPPPRDLRPSTTEPRLYYSEGVGWTGSPEPHQNHGRKMTWHFPEVVVEGEEPTPFQQTAMVADLVNLVANWGDEGLAFINADVTLGLARLPGGNGELGLAAGLRVEEAGIATSTATVFDRQGPLGTATVTALHNAHSSVDPRLLGAVREPVQD